MKTFDVIIKIDNKEFPLSVAADDKWDALRRLQYIANNVEQTKSKHISIVSVKEK